jgi:hypothetical protein
MLRQVNNNYMPDIIKETLADGSEVQIDMDVCNEQASLALDNLFELEGELENFDFVATVFSLYVSCIHILTNSGWNKDELKSEVEYHSQGE